MNQKAEVRSTIEQFFHAMDIQDYELMNQLIPEDETMIHVGTEGDEIWKGSKELREATKEQFLNLEYYKASIYELNINLSKSKDVAWYFHLLDARIKSNGTETIWNGARFSGVVEKRKDHWMIVQTHVSVPE